MGFLVGAQVKTAPLTMHLLLAFMVGTCAAMSVRKSPYVYQSNPMARMSMQARHHSGGNGWTSRSKNPFSYLVGKEFFKNENIEGDHFEGPYEDLPYSVTQNYGNYEKRHYPEAVMACTYDLVDQAGDRYDPSSFHSSQGGEGGQPWQPGGSAHVLLLALRVPANPLPPTQGDKAGPTGATRLDLSANSDGGLQGGDPHQAGNRRLRAHLRRLCPHRGHVGEPEADSP